MCCILASRDGFSLASKTKSSFSSSFSHRPHVPVPLFLLTAIREGVTVRIAPAPTSASGHQKHKADRRGKGHLWQVSSHRFRWSWGFQPPGHSRARHSSVKSSISELSPFPCAKCKAIGFAGALRRRMKTTN